MKKKEYEIPSTALYVIMASKVLCGSAQGQTETWTTDPEVHIFG